MKLVFDVFGGDNAPSAAIDGCIRFLNNHSFESSDQLQLILCGDKSIIEAELEKRDFSNDGRVEILHAPSVITCHEQPTVAIRQKGDSSLVKAIMAVAEEKADCVISAGNSGALLAGATLKIKRISGIKRPALTPCLPTVKNTNVLLIDCGANADCQPEFLAQFALMGDCYMRKMFGISKPRVGLLSNGTEEEKGNELTKQANVLIKKLQINYIGNIEAREIFSGDIDVVVCDGFVGNAVLKAVEGSVKAFGDIMKKELTSGMVSKLGAYLIRSKLRNFKKKFDYRETGGAPLLGVKGGVIKAHGSSDAKAFFNALEQAYNYVKNDVTSEITEEIKSTLEATEN